MVSAANVRADENASTIVVEALGNLEDPNRGQ